MASEIQSFQPQNIERFVAFINPVSQHAKEIQRQVADMQTVLGAEAECAFSTASPEETNERLVSQVLPKLGKNTLFAVFGGDGLANLATEALVGDNSTRDSREATVFFTDNGTASDTARGLLPAKLLKKPDQLLQCDGLAVAEAYPLRAEFETRIGRQSAVVNSYLGVGADADAAFGLNQAKPNMRAMRKYLGAFVGKAVQATAYEPGIVLRHASSSPRFDIKEDDMQHQKKYEDCIELLIGNGARMAKYGRWPLTSLLEESFQTTVRTSRFTGVLRSPGVIVNGMRLARGRLGSEYDNGFMVNGPKYSRAWKIQNIRQTNKNKPLRIQFDGETAEIEEGQLVVSKTPPLRVLTQKNPH